MRNPIPQDRVHKTLEERAADREQAEALTLLMRPVIPPPPQPSGIRAAFRFRAIRYPWSKSTGAALSLGIPLLIGATFGAMSAGMLTIIGGFTSLYVHNEPYAQRAVKLLLVALGISLSFGLGNWVAGTTWPMALTLGVVGTLGYFICGALQVPPPSGYFFVLACAIGTSLPINPAAAPMRAGFALLGGGVAWLVCMSGWLFRPHGPETATVAKSFRDVAAFLAAVGTPDADAAQHQAAVGLRAAEGAVTATLRFRRRQEEAARLFLLTERANALFLAGIELQMEAKGPVSPKLPAAVRNLADAVADPERAESLTMPRPARKTPARERLYRELLATLAVAVDLHPHLKQSVIRQQNEVWSVMKSALGRDSLVLPAALRIGVTVAAATLVALALGNTRPYWVPLSCAAVMQGMTVVATLHRTLQRAIGTTVGILLAGGLLALRPAPLVVALAVMVLQFVVEMIVARNYAFAVTFITPLALIQAEAGNPNIAVGSLIGARLFDTWLGCTLGLAGSLLLWRRSSSARFPVVLSRVIRCEGRVLHQVFAGGQAASGSKLPQETQTLQTALINMRNVYDSAMSEMSGRKTELESLWPAVVAAHRLGNLSIATSEHPQPLALPVEQIERLDFVFDDLAESIEQGRPPTPISVPHLPGVPGIAAELAALQQGLEVGETQVES